MSDTFQPITPAQIEWHTDTPVSAMFEDSYFSIGQGMQESQAVFIDGNRLAERFVTLPVRGLFVIGETGFGTGLNLLLAARLFIERAPASARLHLVSAEKHPLSHADLARASRHWPQLECWSQPLLDQYPPAVPGFHRIKLDERVDLTLMYGDATAMWAQHAGGVDAWCLDGFAPDRNAGMWRAELFAVLAEQSQPGATLASFTVAGHVRRGLEAVGFELKRKPGFGHKRHRLEGRFPGTHQPRVFSTGHALVAGAGLAGASTARALAERGWQVTVIDAQGIASGASGNHAGVVYTTPSAHATAQNRYYQSSYLHALRFLHQQQIEPLGIGCLNGVVQHLSDEHLQKKLPFAMASGYWPETLLKPLDGDRVELTGGGYVQPTLWCRHLLDHPSIEVRSGEVLDWQGHAVTLASGETLQADDIVACVSAHAKTWSGLGWLPLKIIRGQVSYCAASRQSANWQQAECHRGYLTPAIDGVHCIGATFNLHEHDTEPNPADDQANLNQLKQNLPRHWHELGGDAIEVIDRRVGFRCQSSDYLPLAGAMVDDVGKQTTGRWLNLAHGSRGI
ncbi:MAG: bifunctional tRNA (5-methylaminomethyl-2-thiouridine)(34)-methyltransferase MnmD/FAD-dependent 5-carboxymethylaminomethyl-2-thiouridine(34) oxidoreductase MnmC, partial [Pseudomonadota bacterium]